jgi:hypothetical protein
MPELRNEVQIQTELADGSFRCTSLSGVPSARRSWIGIISSRSETGLRLVEELGEYLQSVLTMSAPDVVVTTVTPQIPDPAILPGWRKLLVIVGSPDPPMDDNSTWYSLWVGGDRDIEILPLAPQGAYPGSIGPAFLRFNAFLWRQSITEALSIILSSAEITSSELDLYISYLRSETGPFAEQLFDEMSHEGFDVFLDRFSIPPGQNFQQRINDALGQKSMLVILESRRVRESMWISYEVDYAKKNRMGVLAIQMPDVLQEEQLPFIPAEDRFHLRTTDFISHPVSVSSTIQWERLEHRALARVVATIKRAHTLALLRRRAFYGELERTRAGIEQSDEEQVERNLGNRFVLNSFEWRGVKPFDDGTYSLAPRVNVLLGKNGYGKTLLLRALAAMIQSDPERSRDCFPATPADDSSARLRLTVKRNGESVETLRNPVFFEKTVGKIPLLAIPDSRFVNRTVRTVRPSATGSEPLSKSGAKHFLSQEPYENVVQDLLFQLGFDYLDSGKRSDLPILRLLEEVVRELAEDEEFAFDTIRRSGTVNFEILVRSLGSETPLPIQLASQGTLSVLAIFGLIYSFLKALRPEDSKADVLTTPGIVMIDEVDAHLHPSWQQRIVALLTGKFPNVQFILSAHSPVIVAGCDVGEVSVLRRGESGRGFRIETLQEDFLGATARELYDRVFDIEDNDRLYLEYSIKAAQGGAEEREHEIKALSEQPLRTLQQEERLQELLRESRLIQRAAAVADRRLKLEDSRVYIEKLEDQLENLRAESTSNRVSIAEDQLEELRGKLESARDTGESHELAE